MILENAMRSRAGATPGLVEWTYGDLAVSD